MFFLEKVFKYGKGGKFAVECVSNGVFLENVFSTLILKFLQNKSENF